MVIVNDEVFDVNGVLIKSTTREAEPVLSLTDLMAVRNRLRGASKRTGNLTASDLKDILTYVLAMLDDGSK